jgi:hypothetical protein
MDAKHRLSADLAARAKSRYKELVRDVLAEAAGAGELDLAAAGLTADTAAVLLIASARGLESSADSPAAYRRYLDSLVQVMVAGLRRPLRQASQGQQEHGGRQDDRPSDVPAGQLPAAGEE